MLIAAFIAALIGTIFTALGKGGTGATAAAFQFMGALISLVSAGLFIANIFMIWS